jgi:transcriptional regulator with XRE-family HTH domain
MREDEPSPIGTFIRQQREKKGLTQAALAGLAGTSKSSIQRAEVDGTSDSLVSILAALTDAQTQTQTENHK